MFRNSSTDGALGEVSKSQVLYLVNLGYIPLLLGGRAFYLWKMNWMTRQKQQIHNWVFEPMFPSRFGKKCINRIKSLRRINTRKMGITRLYGSLYARKENFYEETLSLIKSWLLRIYPRYWETTGKFLSRGGYIFYSFERRKWCSRREVMNLKQATRN